MNCYDCAIENQTTPAAAVCRHCGVGVCAEHAHATVEHIHHVAGMGPAIRPVPARRITCTLCYDAEHSTTHNAGSDSAPRRTLIGSRR